MKLFDFIEFIHTHKLRHDQQSLDRLKIYFKENKKWNFIGVHEITIDKINVEGNYYNKKADYIQGFLYQMDFSNRPGQDEIKRVILVKDWSCIRYVFEQDDI